MQELKIDPELRDFLPPLSLDSFKILEQKIIKEGYKGTPIYTWNGYIIDGHNRYEICKKHNIDFVSEELILGDNVTKVDYMEWMLNTQQARRNLSAAEKLIIAEKLRNKISEEAKEKQKEFHGNRFTDKVDFSPIGEKSTLKTNPLHTDKEISKIAGVGTGTVARFNTVMKSDNEELKQKVRNNEISINAAYEQIKAKEKRDKKNILEPVIPNNQPNIICQTKKCIKCKVIKFITEFDDTYDICKECMKDPYRTIERDYAAEVKGDDEVSNIVRELKTPKVAADYIIPKNELLSIKNMLIESLENADERIFNRYKMYKKMTQEDKKVAITYINQISDQLLKLKNKIANIKIEGANNNVK